ncbi:MAG: carotenoid 1,2-hydratase [Gammaproteobacteria bacterium]|nr:carotenoid 1,2-hydratase [Gammaproteobacteria bacterium]
MPERARCLLLIWLLAAVPAGGEGGSSAAPPPGSDGRPGLDLGALIGGDFGASADGQTGFAVADAPRVFVFPADHGPHPDFRSEWWYLVSHLKAPDGRDYGVQFTLFRQALAPEVDVDAGDSRWRTRQVWMAHVAVSGPDGVHRAGERFARDALGLAGVRAEPFAAWLEDWRLESIHPDQFFPLRLTAKVDDVPRPFAVDLVFDGARGPILQGDQGFSRKSERAGNASYYYSYTRMAAQGQVRLDGDEVAVDGLGWMDREWSTSVLDPGQVGWDWFALHLDDGRDLMVFQIRRDDGSIDGASSGVIVAEDGSSEALTAADFSLEPLSSWQDETGAAWPVSWRLTVPALGISGRVEARHPDQLNRLAVRYWEGRVCLDGPVPGCGYLEMTGYTGP